jgi:hypothetical protein
VDRSFPVPTSTRNRLHAVVAGAAMAFIAGLSAPAAVAGADAGSPEQATLVQAEMIAQEATAAPAPAAQPVGAPAQADAPSKPAAPPADQLHPRAVGGSQEKFVPDAEQLRNAREIVQTGQKMGLPPRAWVIAIATALQESALHNLGDLGANNDHDSLGLFQQRPSSGWGTPEQVRDPAYSSTSFYKGLIAVPGWDKMDLTDAAQAVQVSAFPDHYAKWETQAGNLVKAMYYDGPYAEQAAGLK